MLCRCSVLYVISFHKKSEIIDFLNSFESKLTDIIVRNHIIAT